jgi:hypothetical protein
MTEGKDKFKGFFVGDFQPKRFLQKGVEYKWAELTPAQIKTLAEDPNFNAIRTKEQVELIEAKKQALIDLDLAKQRSSVAKIQKQAEVLEPKPEPSKNAPKENDSSKKP